MNCCTTECLGCYSLGCYGHCDEVIMPFNALESGIHILEITFRGRQWRFDVDLFAGESVRLPNQFNEDSKSKFKIKQPSGAYYDFTIDGVTYDCFTTKNLVTMSFTDPSIFDTQHRTFSGKPICETVTTPTNIFTIPSLGDNKIIDVNSVLFIASGNPQAPDGTEYGYSSVLNSDGSVTITTTQNLGSVDDPCKVIIHYSYTEIITV